MNLKEVIKSLVKDMVEELVKACKSVTYMAIEHGVLEDAFGVEIGISLVVILGFIVFRGYWEHHEPRQSLLTYLTRCAGSLLLFSSGSYLWSLMGGSEKLSSFALMAVARPDLLFNPVFSLLNPRKRQDEGDLLEDIRLGEVVSEAAEKSGMPKMIFEMLLFLITYSAVRFSAHIGKIFETIIERCQLPRGLRE